MLKLEKLLRRGTSTHAVFRLANAFAPGGTIRKIVSAISRPAVLLLVVLGACAGSHRHAAGPEPVVAKPVKIEPMPSGDRYGGMARVEGRVVDATTDEPLLGATVASVGDGYANRSVQTAITGLDGRYVFVVAPGVVHLTAYYSDLVVEWATRVVADTSVELPDVRPTGEMLYVPYVPRCDPWGHGDGDCAQGVVGKHPVQVGFGLGGGIAEAGGRAMTYFLWGFDARYAVTPYLAIGIADIGVRVGSGDDGNHGALVATPIIELSRREAEGGENATGYQLHLDLGVTGEHVVADPSPPRRNPFGLRLAVGYRLNVTSRASFDISLGVSVALTDGFVIDDYAPAGSVLPFLQVGFGYRP